MGKKSVRPNKNLYMISRESLDLTREDAAELTGISADRLEKIENEKSLPHPDEVLMMAKYYKNPSINNYFCSHECPIGQQYVPAIPKKELSQIVLEMLASLNNMNREKERLIEITADGKIGDDELEDFHNIQEQLSKISASVESLRLWVEEMIAKGNITASSSRQN
ncbi:MULTISPECIES: helix-turn-helix domain-containing protein [Butyrivibrio]|jgi:transcriptional regulator with XRE-family HTH domain|uniref:Helix-turn-helix n=1 Tax=Butyrivibrio fibrisolvens TaxID=831 RepID=A0A1H9WPN1_BUTFI|nr:MULTISPECIES: helix-turn-helix transcriptional regulator [Butyrivibrio]MBQ1457557.1 helix-turn-helix domain-containing protein [Butyrivibrio sp.]MCR4636187.1 helix-turn-helix transcriptional regulator [Butyrivibrio sp.]PWT25916.1 XRE family transcriptional regulator [Butyrivibrio fibrisolvens]SEQ49954.1 Helix-turn-helix [Butyrivibrio sp. TB]SES35637.1 Helix-turn-helix [Butyrivibrio fibrisolvens]